MYIISDENHGSLKKFTGKSGKNQGAFFLDFCTHPGYFKKMLVKRYSGYTSDLTVITTVYWIIYIFSFEKKGKHTNISVEEVGLYIILQSMY